MDDEEKEEISQKIETLDPSEQKTLENLNIEQSVKEVSKKKKGCYFPSAHAILLILEVIVFILTYVIPKGKYNCIKYQENINRFNYITYNQKGERNETDVDATQENLDKWKIKIKLEDFKNGYVKDDVAIPGTYQELKEVEQLNVLKVLIYPILGLIDCADIAFFFNDDSRMFKYFNRNEIFFCRYGGFESMW